MECLRPCAMCCCCYCCCRYCYCCCGWVVGCLPFLLVGSCFVVLCLWKMTPPVRMSMCVCECESVATPFSHWLSLTNRVGCLQAPAQAPTMYVSNCYSFVLLLLFCRNSIRRSSKLHTSMRPMWVWRAHLQPLNKQSNPTAATRRFWMRLLQFKKHFCICLSVLPFLALFSCVANVGRHLANY